MNVTPHESNIFIYLFIYLFILLPISKLYYKDSHINLISEHSIAKESHDNTTFNKIHKLEVRTIYSKS